MCVHSKMSACNTIDPNLFGFDVKYKKPRKPHMNLCNRLTQAHDFKSMRLIQPNRKKCSRGRLTFPTRQKFYGDDFCKSDFAFHMWKQIMHCVLFFCLIALFFAFVQLPGETAQAGYRQNNHTETSVEYLHHHGTI